MITFTIIVMLSEIPKGLVVLKDTAVTKNFLKKSFPEQQELTSNNNKRRDKKEKKEKER